MNKIYIYRTISFLSGIIVAIIFILLLNSIVSSKIIKNRVGYIYSTNPVRVIQDDLIYDYNKEDMSLSLHDVHSDKRIIRVDNKVLLTNGIHNEVTAKPLTIKNIEDSFSSNTITKMFIDLDVSYNLNLLIENNPNLEKIIIKDIQNNSGNDKVYFFPEDVYIGDSFNLSFNISKKDYTFLYPNVIYSLNKYGNRSDYVFFDDYDNETIEYRYYIDEPTFYGWYLDSACTIPYNYDTVITKQYDINDDGDKVYIYKPIVLYARWLG